MELKRGSIAVHGILEFHLQEVLLRKAVADAAIVELSMARNPLGHRALDASDHVLEACAVRLDDQQPARACQQPPCSTAVRSVVSSTTWDMR